LIWRRERDSNPTAVLRKKVTNFDKPRFGNKRL
jgi:hypothetical protein